MFLRVKEVDNTGVLTDIANTAEEYKRVLLRAKAVRTKERARHVVTVPHPRRPHAPGPDRGSRQGDADTLTERRGISVRVISVPGRRMDWAGGDVPGCFPRFGTGARTQNND